MPPAVSVIIPTFNSAATICQAIDSVLAQTLGDLEIIVVDDGSTDDTARRLRPYEDRIDYYYQPNQERSVARNRGIGRSRGTFIAFLDADDYWLPSKLELQLPVMRAHPELGLVYSWVNVVDQSGKTVGRLGHDLPHPESTGADYFEQLLLGDSVPTPSVVVRRDCLDSVGLFDESITYCEDWDLWLRIAGRYPFGHVAQVTACYRVRHSYLPEIFARHGLQVKRPCVIERALTARPDIGIELATRARQRVRWYSALIEFGMRDCKAAQGWVERMLRQGTVRDARAADLEGYLVAFALSLYDDHTPEAEATAFVRFVLDNLLPELAFLRARGRRIAGTVLAGYAFRARARGDYAAARATMRRALAKNPASASNLGVLTTCVVGTWLDRVRGRHAEG
ncbi:MAG TPA: glycosyltransferase [Anaerolineae bacterium]|nr:glycosyltransferase [Anaerolineae bacterium]